MSLSKYESEVKVIPQNIESVFEKLSDLRNLAPLKEKILDPNFQEKIGEQIEAAKKMSEAQKYLEKAQFEEDSISMESPVGNIVLKIIEREAPKLLKFGSEGSPIPINVWLQLAPVDDASCKLRVTVGAEVNFFMKGMVAKPLQQAANGLANMLALVR